jgi:hypothetical protein
MQLNLFGFKNIKICGSCKKVLPIYFFYRDKRWVNTFSSYCKKCNKLRSKNWVIENKEKRKKIRKKTYLKNKENELLANKRWRIENKIKYNKKRNRTRKIKYKKNNIYNLKCKIRTSINRSLKIKNFNKNTKTANILGADWDTFKKYFENQFTDNMSWDNFDKIHIDHKIPLAAASTEFEVIALNHYTNLQPLWAEDNLKKSDKYDPEDFKKYMEWYTKNVKPYPKL